MSSKRQYGFWRTLYSSLYSRSLYRDVAKKWLGSGAFYLLLLILLSGVFNTGKMLYDLNNPDQAVDSQNTEITQTSRNAIISDGDGQQIDINTEIEETTGKHSSLATILIVGLNVIFLAICYVTVLLAGLVIATISKAFVRTLNFKALYRLAIVATTPSFVLGSAFFMLVPADILPALSTSSTAAFLLIPLGYYIYGIRANVAYKEQLKTKLGE